MGRKISTGSVPGGLGGVNIDDATITTADVDKTLTISPNGTGEVTITTNVNLAATSDLRFWDTDTSNYVAFQGASAIDANVIWTLPATDGSNGQIIQTNGGGTLTFADPGIAVNDETTDSTTLYPLFGSTTSGTLTGAEVSTTKLTYVPSTGTLSATYFNGPSASVTLTADNSTNATNYPLFSNAATGDVSPRTDTGFTYNPSTGELTAVILTASSDVAGKKDIETIDDAMSKVLSLRGVSYRRKENDSEEIGVIAQELEQVIPSLVRGQDGSKSVAYGNLVALLIEAVKEQHQEIQELKGRLS